MKRLLLAILLLILFVLTVPALRARAAPRFNAMAGAVWDRLEGPLGPAINPWRTISTKSEMSRIVNTLVGLRNQGFAPPDPDDFPAYIARQDIDEHAQDAWGSVYTIESSRDSVFVQSAGVDRVHNTADDIVLSLRYPSPYRRGRGPRGRR